jgi:hypothetical protein
LSDSWRHIKKDFLHHFHKPRLDLLVWILVAKLAPTYYRKLDLVASTTGRYRGLPSWRKQFKREWKKLANTPIMMPLNEKYRPDPQKWVCTCPALVRSRFLICKHLVQAVQPVPPIFFLQVNRNRTLPFWQHPTLLPLDGSTPNLAVVHAGFGYEGNDAGHEHEDDDSSDIEEDVEDDIIDTEAGLYTIDGATFRERFEEEISMIRDFCNGLEYQLQFGDQRMLETLEREGASFLRLARNCLSRERRSNTTRGASPSTWDRATANAMFYRTRPRAEDVNT